MPQSITTLRLLPPAGSPSHPASRPPLATATGAHSRALIADHPADLALNAQHVDLYDRPLTRAGAGRAHLARGTRSQISDAGVAVFLAEARR